jgi:hypothetical protein
MAQNRGELFEDQFKASVPAEAYVRKLNTAGPRAQNLGSIASMLSRLAKVAGEEVPGWAMGMLTASQHTPKTPFDMFILAPVRADPLVFQRWYRRTFDQAGRSAEMLPEPGWEAWQASLKTYGGSCRDHQGAPMWLAARPALTFALELKSAGTAKNLPFERIKPHQEDGMLKAAALGYVAGVVVEFPDIPPLGEVYFLPIGSFLAYKRECGRQSLPLEAARIFGQLIEVDHGRGIKHRYWRVAEFLRHYGADVPPTAEPRRRSQA